ncbi:unnamed protein product [Urochloa decumbens]|uniref:RING-type E3 ubiquitin transferase n=1 Tax=Urochloa decumbens TaxID=240449 RepID=A0ABC9A5A4_9POAL
MEATSKIVTRLLLNLVLLLPCFSAGVSSNPSFHRKGPIHHDYTRFADVERHCQSVLSSAAELGGDDAGRAGARMHQLSFMNGDWSQDAGRAPLLPFHGTYADTAATGPESLDAVPLTSFTLTHMDMAPRRGSRTAFNVSGILTFTVARNCCRSYMVPRVAPEFELRPGVARLHVLLQGVYTEKKPSESGGERVLCMVGDALLPVRGSNSDDPWDWAKNNHGGDGMFEPPVVADGNILLLLRYPMAATLTTRAVRGEMKSTSTESGGAYFDTVRLASQLGGGYDFGYRFQPEGAELDAAVAGCGGDDPLFHGGGGAMEHLNLNLDRGGASLCDIVHQSAPGHQAMEVIPNWDCKGTDEFCSRVGPFNTTTRAAALQQDMAFSRSGIAVQGLECKPAPSVDGTAAARVAAVFRYVPPWEHQPTAASRTGLSGGMTLVAEGVWIASTGRVCMVACLDGRKEACHYRVTLSVRRTLSLTRRGNNIGRITAMDGSHPPLLFQQRGSPREQRLRSGSGEGTTRMSYMYTKVEQAAELLRVKPTGFRDNFVAKSVLSYPDITGAADDLMTLSDLADDLNLRFRCDVKPPFEGPFFELQILSVGTLVGSYSPQFQQQLQSGFGRRIEQLARVPRVHAEQKQHQILNVSAEFTAAPIRNNFFGPVPVTSLEGVYNPEVGRMHLIGCRNIHAPWRVLSNLRDLEDGMDCSIEVTVEYPATTTRWLISQPAKVSVASTRGNDDPLHFNRTMLRTLPVVCREQRRGELTEPIVEGLLCIAMLSATVAATVSQLRHVESHADVAPYISLAMLGVQALGYSATLVTDAKVLPAAARRYKPYYYADYPDSWWDMDCSVKALTLAALLLTGGSPRSASATTQQQPGWAIYGKAQGMPSPAPGGSYAVMPPSWHMRTRAAVVEGYVGVVKEWFLLPQVIGNALWRVNCKPLAARYYAGVTVVWLLPHVYGYLRPPVVNPYSESEAYDDVVAFYSKASAMVVPVVGLVLALVVYVQQRWNYKIVGWAMGTERNKLQHVY